MERLDESVWIRETATVTLETSNGRTPVHLFDEPSILAVNTAIDCGRPLLVRGEPGTGKSQLAQAVAAAARAAFLSRVVDARTEAHELKWEYDAIGRLADANAHHKDAKTRPEQIDYVIPGPLWWAFNWTGAREHTKPRGMPEPSHGRGSPSKGVVLLIDEIDKADIAVPNALLESLGQGQFSVPGFPDPICIPDYSSVEHDAGPLVIMTTNTDRLLPDAFIRRCVVLHFEVPEAGIVSWLVDRGEVQHFPGSLRDGVREKAAEVVVEARRRARGQRGSRPGLAEYIDLLTALSRVPEQTQFERIQKVAPYVLNKHHKHSA